MREPAPQAGVGVDERAHLVFVAGHDHREVLALLLHHLDERGDGLVTEVDEAVGGERVRLVDEQHAADRLLDDLLDLDRGLADIPGDQIRSTGLDQMALADQPGHGVQARDDLRHGRLARARITGEDQVLAGVDDGESGLRSFLVEVLEGEQPADRRLDLAQPDQRVQLGEEAGFGVGGRRAGRWGLDLGRGGARGIDRLRSPSPGRPTSRR